MPHQSPGARLGLAMTARSALRVRAQDLQPFEPTRLGSRTPDFAHLVSQFAGQKQSAIVRLVETAAQNAMKDADGDLEALALGVTCLVLRDYITAGNYPIASSGSLYLANLLSSESLTPGDHRALLQRQYEAARRRALRDRGQLRWLRDGLRNLQHAGYAPHEVIDLLRQGPPETLMLDARENRFGLDTRGLWRCVRATWSMAPEASAPGREVAFVVVDQRVPTTPLGILQFRNVVPEITSRDHWLGTAVGELSNSNPGSGFLGLVGTGRIAFARALSTLKVLEDLLESVNREGLDLPSEPSSLRALSEMVRQRRRLFDETRREGEQGLKNEHLRVVKRAQTVHDLLRGILGLRALLDRGFSLASDEVVRSDIDAGLTKLWHYHMGFVAIEMSICGAAPPFGPLRVGKLMASLAGATPVLDAWGRDRGLGEIAKQVYLPSVRDRVPNPGPLVIFTSGLYPGHSAQYSRVRSAAGVWRKIGETTGYGSFHISFETSEALGRLNRAIDGYAHITRSFGEGSGARFRSVGRGLGYLGLPDLRKHETRRPMYALPLVSNPREVLLGWEESSEPKSGDPVRLASDWWRRWVSPRLPELADSARRSNDLEATLSEVVGGFAD